MNEIEVYLLCEIIISKLPPRPKKLLRASLIQQARRYLIRSKIKRTYPHQNQPTGLTIPVLLDAVHRKPEFLRPSRDAQNACAKTKGNIIIKLPKPYHHSRTSYWPEGRQFWKSFYMDEPVSFSEAPWFFFSASVKRRSTCNA